MKYISMEAILQMEKSLEEINKLPLHDVLACLPSGVVIRPTSEQIQQTIDMEEGTIYLLKLAMEEFIK